MFFTRTDIPHPFMNYGHAENSAKFHDAAYDAYATGKSFATMMQHIGSQAKPPITDVVDKTLLTPFLNK